MNWGMENGFKYAMTWIWINESLSSHCPPYESPGIQEVRTEPHHREKPTILIIVDTNDAGDRVKISRGQELLRVSGEELSIHHCRDDLEDLRGITINAEGP